MDWKALIGTVAPWMATAVTGPLGGMAVTAISDALGLSDKTESSIKAALSGVTAEQMLALKNADQAFSVKMQELGYANIEALANIAAKDRQSAREMMIATRSFMPALLSIIVVVWFLAILTGMMTGYFKVQPENQYLVLLLGTLATAFGVVMAFWMGTTSDSGRKTELLAQTDAIKK